MEDSESCILSRAKQEFGLNAAMYLKNKRQGGRNNESGAEFERKFAIYMTAKVFDEYLTSGNHITLSAQELAFVDDLVVYNETKRAKCSYQLKSGKQVDWMGGKHSIMSDFQMQYHMDSLDELSHVRTFLVVSDEILWQCLKNMIPESIQSHTDCLFFPNWPINRALLEATPIRYALENICCFDSIDKLEHLYIVLSGVWQESSKRKVSIGELMVSAHKILPNFIKTVDNYEIEADIKEIFDKIDGLKVEARGYSLYLHYNKNGKIFECIIDTTSNDYKDLLNEVRIVQPSSFKDLLDLGLI